MVYHTRRALVSFSVGNSYKDEIYYDIVPMDACHLFLGRPWEFDRKVIHDGFHNTYCFSMDNKKFLLKPAPTKQSTLPSKPVLLMQRSPFEAAMREEGMVYILLSKATNPFRFKDVPAAFQQPLCEFSDVFPEDLPDGLPPLRDIQHRIDFLPMHRYLTVHTTG